MCGPFPLFWCSRGLSDLASNLPGLMNITYPIYNTCYSGTHTRKRIVVNKENNVNKHKIMKNDFLLLILKQHSSLLRDPYCQFISRNCWNQRETAINCYILTPTTNIQEYIYVVGDAPFCSEFFYII